MADLFEKYRLELPAGEKQESLDAAAAAKKAILGLSNQTDEPVEDPRANFSSIEDYQAAGFTPKIQDYGYFRTQRFARLDNAYELGKEERSERNALAYADDSELGTLTGQSQQLLAGAEIGTRRMVKNAAITPSTLDAINSLKGIDDRSRELFTTDRDLNDEENAYLDSIPEPTQEEVRTGQYVPSGQTRRERLDSAVKNIDKANMIADVFESSDREKILNPLNREDLMADFNESVAESAAYMEFAEGAFKEGKYGEATVSGLQGIATFVKESLGDAINNPAATFEFIAEQVPQLVAGAVSRPVLLATNLTYSVDVYRDAIEDYQATNDGKLPTQDEAAKMLGWSMTAAIAEQIGDAAILKQLTKVPYISKVINKADDVIPDGAKKAAQKVFKNAVAGTAGATVKGYTTEFATELYQTAVEENLSKLDSSIDWDKALIGGALGGVAGGTMAGGVRAGSEIVARKRKGDSVKVGRSDPEVVAKLTEAALESGDVSAMLDPTKTREYNPAQAAMVLFARTMEPDEEQSTKARTELEELSVNQEERIRSLEADINGGNIIQRRRANRELKEAVEYNTEIQKARALVEMDARVAAQGEQEADLETIQSTEDTPERQEAADRVIQLMMDRPDMLEDAGPTLLSSPAFTEDQRAVIQSFTSAHAKLNALRDSSEVEAIINNGAVGFKGLTQFGNDVAAALRSGNVPAAKAELTKLRNFYTDHRQKRDAFKAAAKAQSETNKNQYVYRDSASESGWVITEQKPWGDRTEQGQMAGFAVAASPKGTNSVNKMIRQLSAETDAIEATGVALASSVALKEGVNVGAVISEIGLRNEPPAETDEELEALAGQAAARDAERETNNEPSGRTDTGARRTSTSETSEAAVSQPTSEQAPANAAPQVQAVAGDAQTETTSSVTAEEVETEAQVAAEEAQAETDAVTEDGKLSLFNEVDPVTEGDPTATFRGSNRIRTGFVQSATGTPLVAIKDFLSSVLNNAGLLQSLVTKQISDEQAGLFGLFQGFMTDSSGNNVSAMDLLTDLLNNSKDNAFARNEDYALFFKDNLDENVLTALGLSGFTWVIENASHYNNDDAIRAILGEDSDYEVTNVDYATYANAGIRRNLVVNALGQRAREALGLKPRKDAGVNEVHKLELSLGEYILTMLEKRGIVDVFTPTDADTTNDWRFIRVSRNADGELLPWAQAMVDQSKGTESFLSKLFGIPAGQVWPSDTPHEFSQKTAKNSRQQVPKVLAAALNKLGKVKHFIRQDMRQIREAMSYESMREIAGYVNLDQVYVHESNVNAQKAKNEGIERGIQNLEEFDASRGNDPFYMLGVVWKQFRVGFAENMVNPQTDKYQRHNISMEKWDTTIDPREDSKVHQRFKLAVAQGFGVAVDKELDFKSLELFEAKLASDNVRDAIEAIQRVKLSEEAVTFTADEEASIRDAVAELGEKTHSLDALVNQAEYELALEDGRTFNTQMMFEVDGVANGPALANIGLGAVNAAFGAMVGFYTGESAHTHFTAYKSTQGYDLYERTVDKLVRRLESDVTNSTPMMYISRILGDLKTDDSPDGLTVGRKRIKTPLTGMIFGSGLKTASNNMAEEFVSLFYERIEKAVNKEDQTAVDSIVEAANKLMPSNIPIEVETLPESLMVVPKTLSSKQHLALKKSFDAVVGEQVRELLKEDFEEFREKRDVINGMAQMAWARYNVAMTHARKLKTEQLIRDGLMPVNKNGKPLRDLTKEEIASIEQVLLPIKPVVHTFFSKLDKNLASGLDVSDRGKRIAEYEETLYRAEVVIDGKSSKPRAVVPESGDPGVAPTIMLTHSSDSAIAMYAYNEFDALHIHDAEGFALSQTSEGAQMLNKSTYGILANYSLPLEILAMMERSTDEKTLAGLEARLPGLTRLLGKAADTKEGIQPQVKALLEAEIDKLAFLEQIHFVDQYALEGGAHAVTEEERAAVSKRKAEVLAKLRKVQGNQQTEQQPETKSVLDPVVPTERNTPWGVIGQSSVQSNPRLVAMLQNSPTVKQLLHGLASEINAQHLGKSVASFQGVLLKQIAEVVNPNLTINFITPNTPYDPAVGDKTSALGWYSVSKDGETINIKSDAFAVSGITTELLLHELVHASVAKLIFDIENGRIKKSSDTYKSYLVLEDIRKKAEAFVKLNNMDQFSEAVKSVDELVAVGMSNSEFQMKVLAKIDRTTRQADADVNRVKRSGFGEFVRSLAGMLFGTNKIKESLQTGLGSLIVNTAMLVKTDADSTADRNVSLDMAIADPRRYTPQEVFTALGRTNAVSPARAKYLTGALQQVVSAVFPDGAIRQEALRRAPRTADEVYLTALQEGQAPYSFTANGILKLNSQEGYVLESLEVAMEETLKNSDVIRKELNAIFKQAKAQIQAKDLYDGDWDSATERERAKTQAIHDFLFTIVQEEGGNTSRYLSRFVAASVAYQPLHDALTNTTVPDARPSLREGTMAQRINNFLDRAMTYLTRMMTGVRIGQSNQTVIHHLAMKLATIEQKKKTALAKAQDRGENVLSRSVKNATEYLRVQADRAGRSSIFRNSRSGLVRAGGVAVSTIAGGRADEVMGKVQDLRNLAFDEKDGLLGSLATEVRGENDGNTMFHKLLAWGNKIEQDRKHIIDDVGREVLNMIKRKLSRDDEKAISQVVVRNDLAKLMDDFTLDQIAELLTDKAKLQSTIRQYEQQLSNLDSGYSRYYLVQSKALGYYLATGKVTVGNLMLNAYNVATLAGTKYQAEVTSEQVEAAVPIIDMLASLRAIQHTNSDKNILVANIIKEENARDETEENGMEFLLKLNSLYKQESLDQLFAGDPTQQMKGYVKDKFNPHIDIVAATDRQAEELIKVGYVPVLNQPLSKDPLNPGAPDRKLYIMKDGGNSETINGFMPMSGRRARGSQLHNGLYDLKTGEKNQRNVISQSRMSAQLDREIESMMNASESWTAEGQTGPNRMVPIINSQGGIANFRFLMEEDTKDDLLERENTISNVMGGLYGSLHDKVHSAELGQAGVEALHKDYVDNVVRNPTAYMTFGPDSTDPVVRERYLLLPDATKKAILHTFGSKSMQIRKDMYNITFGYRKFSMRDMFMKDFAERNVAEKMLVGLVRIFFGNQAARRVAQAENAIQEMVTMVKDIWVIKNLFTLIGNESSNMTVLWMAGVPMKDIVRDKIVAYRATIDYAKARREHDNLKRQLDARYAGTIATSVMQQRVVELEDEMARSPVKDLIDAGMFQTLVEDVGEQRDDFSFQSKLTRAVNKRTEWVPDSVKSVGKFALMTHDTSLYKVLNLATMYSDFTARYVMHQYYTNRALDPLSSEESIRRSREAFVNYDVPTHRSIQYLNDMGVLFFTKYYVRIQKVIFEMVRENPLNAFRVWALGDWLFNFADILDSSILQKTPGNLGGSFTELPGAVKEILPIHLMTD